MRVASENKAAHERLADALPSDFQAFLVRDLEAKLVSNAEERARMADQVAETKQAYKAAQAAEQATVQFNVRGVGVRNLETIKARQETRRLYAAYKQAERWAVELQTAGRDLALRLRQARAGLPQAAEQVKRLCDAFGNPYEMDLEATRKADMVIRDAQREDLAGGRLGHAVNVHLRREARRRQAAESEVGEDE
jgi:hypothetical protein